MFTYLLFDFPSDHEVEGLLATECDVIRTLIANKGHGKNVKVVRATTFEGITTEPQFRNRSKLPAKPYHVKYVHISCHGTPEGKVGFIGHEVSWRKVAREIRKYISPLRTGEQRVLCLSSCYSNRGAEVMESELEDYFSGVYYLVEEKVEFATTMVIWSMVYHRKSRNRPFANVIDRVNSFFGPKPADGKLTGRAWANYKGRE